MIAQDQRAELRRLFEGDDVAAAALLALELGPALLDAIDELEARLSAPATGGDK